MRFAMALWTSIQLLAVVLLQPVLSQVNEALPPQPAKCPASCIQKKGLCEKRGRCCHEAATCPKFEPSGKYRCHNFQCHIGFDSVSPFINETQTIMKVGENLYNILSNENDASGPSFNQSFSMVQNPFSELELEGTLYDRHQDGSPPYHNGYPGGFQPATNEGIPVSYYQPPLATYKIQFKSEAEFHGMGLFARPGIGPGAGPHACFFPKCVKISV